MIFNKNQYAQNIELLRKCELPDTFQEVFIKEARFDCPSADVFAARELYTNEFGFTLFSKDWIEPLADFLQGSKCLEIMAGRGLLSYFLKQYGINIKATDDFSWGSWNNNSINVINLDCVAATNTYGRYADYIICSWPYMDNNLTKCLKLMRRVNKNCKLIMIGEGQGGCTADDEFYEIAEYIRDSKISAVNREYTSWPGINDLVQLCK